MQELGYIASCTTCGKAFALHAGETVDESTPCSRCGRYGPKSFIIMHAESISDLCQAASDIAQNGAVQDMKQILETTHMPEESRT